jgi:cytochrome c
MSFARIAALGALAAGLSIGAPAGAQDAGEKVFKRSCGACHTVDAGKNKIGPSLHGIVGRKAGSVDDYKYSDANKNSGVTWDEATLDAYLENPRKEMPGTKMVFPGLKKPEDRKAVIAYLEQQK